MSADGSYDTSGAKRMIDHAGLLADTPSTPEGMVVTNAQLARLGDGDIKRGRRVLRTLIMDEREQAQINGPTARPANVRLATINDEQAVFNLVSMEMSEIAGGVAPTHPETVASMIISATRAGKGIIGVIDGPDGFPVATIALFNEKWWWSQSWFFNKTWEYVHPDHRHSSHARDLINFAHWFGDEMTRLFGYRVYVLEGVLANRRMRDKVRLYKRHSNAIGAFFIYPMPPTIEAQNV